MQYIKLDELMRIINATDVESLEEACKEIAVLNSDEERKKYLEANSYRWTKIRYALWHLGNMKCWYSEDRIQEGEGEVEHYRPKGNVCKSRHTGYWWLAFDWHNYRLAHSTCNKRRTDFLTQKKAGKGMYFPLKDENKRAYTPADVDFEEPTLLDPLNPNDIRLIWFNTSSGKPEPSMYCKNDPWNITRVKETIGYYHLDEGTWNKDRFDIAKAVNTLCIKIIEARQQNDIKKEEELIDELIRDYANDFAPFSSIALQVLKENGLYDLL